jgi:4-amino-4-deoxy-L-arabinose transferase-like glycosyltransferase
MGASSLGAGAEAGALSMARAISNRHSTIRNPQSVAESRWRWLTNPWLHVALILLVAGFFRLWQIGQFPPGLFGDEATDGLDALDVLRGHGAVFFPANFGREGLHIWIVAAAFRLLGVTPLALRLPSALAGILTALATYWLGRELATAALRSAARTPTESPRPFARYVAGILPMVAALYLSTSYWHIHFSRFGIRGVFTPLCAALAFAAFWRAVNVEYSRSAAQQRSATAVWFAISGLFLGLGAHFYTASRFLPIFLGGYLVLQWIAAALTRRPQEAILPRHWRAVILLYAVAAVVFAPLGWYFLTHPGSFSQRASAVSAFGGGHPWATMAQAGWANILQFFLPGRGDMAQFYNLPGRPVFDVLTAALALVGIGVLLWRWRQGWALFLLTWWPALLVPSFLATDRYPTLPRVLGTIPGVYFFPAVGLAALAWMSAQIINRIRRQERSGLGVAVPVLICAAALLVHAGSSYHDYFQVWGPSPATFDAFEGDMAAASDWLAAHPASGHVYLSSDIYRHPTFMLLHEHATVLTYFEHQDPALSWFDASAALPLPPAGQPATYLLAANPSPVGAAGKFLIDMANLRGQIDGPDGQPALLVMELPADAAWPEQPLAAPVRFSPALTLVSAGWERIVGGQPMLRLRWQTDGPVPQDWPGYRLEIVNGQGSQTVPFDAFRAAEWVAGGQFVSWHKGAFDGKPGQLRLRLVRADGGQPLTSTDAPDGWRTVTVQ